MTGCTLRICLVRDNRHFFRDLTAAADTQARTPASAGLRMVAPDTQARTPNGSAGLRMVAPDTHARTPNGSAGLRMVAPDTHARTPNGSAGLHHPARNARLRESDGHPDHSGSWGVQVAPPNSLDGLPGIQGNGPRGSQRGYPGTQRPGWAKVLALWHAGSHAVARCRPMNCDKAAIQAFRASSIETHPLGPRRRDFCVEKTPCVWSSYHSCPFTNMRAERDSEGEGERERESDKGKKIEQT